MEAVSFGNIPLVAEMQSLSELVGVADEDLSLCFVCKVVEEIVEEHTELRSVVAVNKFLVDFPGNWTHVSELRD